MTTGLSPGDIMRWPFRLAKYGVVPGNATDIEITIPFENLCRVSFRNEDGELRGLFLPASCLGADAPLVVTDKWTLENCGTA